ncbi:hypothetical protein BACCELL_04098 [Bacteroides cellulosilyticus DSM 14838]|uniref:Uncharacterized protein n=1 Tax=Bacteroides cellulosilyticus DSM 14838 TaxID=537012 RepID=E2NIG5_9BACE|nr:hypothetical protein BACCELL_04098 [Bacteroides cellulosilyticus DSM 14838]
MSKILRLLLCADTTKSTIHHLRCTNGLNNPLENIKKEGNVQNLMHTINCTL